MANRISGGIPKELGNISTMQRLVVEANQLEGTIPPELGNLSRIKRLFLNSNKFTGQLPSQLANLKTMTDFWISGSNFTGSIPDFIGNWTSIQLLMIIGTSLQGPIPSSISALTKMTNLRITDLSGPGSSFPDLSNMNNLQELILRNCSISGSIPTYIGSLTQLKYLDLSFNNLSGQVPESFPSSLQAMFLDNNKLTGSMPDWIFSSNDFLDVSKNTFTGRALTTCPQGNLNFVASHSSTNNNSVPACYRKDFPCSSTPKYSSLFINCGGPAYTSIDGRKYEADMDARGESFFVNHDTWAMSSSGMFMDIGSGTYLVSNTSTLSMKADPTLYTKARISPTTMTYYGLCLQNGNYTVELHFAELMFTNGPTFTSIGERIFDIYIQNERVLANFDIAREAGGSGKPVDKNFTANVTANTLEITLYWAGKGTLAVPNRGVYGPLISAISVTPNFVPRDFDDEKRETPTAVIIVVVIAACLIIILFLVILRMKGCLGGKPPLDKELQGLELQTGYFSLKQIKAATRNFNSMNKIGEGGFGPVYKGTLPDGTVIAVKQLSSRSRQGNREFLTEIGMISALQHPNLVKLFGCCIEGNQLMLVYEYLENNSLARALFGPPENRLKLNWPTRSSICIGIAKGLAYLHEESRLKIVHRDIKATNVLLDKDLNAKISDFGLAKLDEGDNTHISTRIAGTIGYMAPEYATRGYLTDKADVYSFGIVALEIVSGRNNTTPMPEDDGTFLLDSAYVLQEKGRLRELVDPSLESNFSEEEALRMLKVALLCTSPSPSLRPKMSTIVDMLEGRTEVYQVPIVATVLNRAFVGARSQHLSQYSTTQSQSSTGQSSGRGPWMASSESISIVEEDHSMLIRSASEQSLEHLS
ncbi:probable LRR receptor-like serine/threonine-protein kinase At1g53440 isoform X2 [Nymphaea colorata]|nr:probable LRR receptor-like serine/threonine-protein kinase At1g53440 isoform X2 [Nymphaea colorata]XP_049934567.1 probable LRR receptor-like serine/threonine-protein kinase At1g53440 isoform X2 [Nymphaea colorata]